MSTVCYWKLWFIVDLPINSMVIFRSYVTVYQRVSFSHVEICGNYIKASCPRDVFWTLYGALRSPKSNSMGYTFLLHQFSRILEIRSGFESFLGPLNWHELTMSALNWVSTLYQGNRETFPVPSSCPSAVASEFVPDRWLNIWTKESPTIKQSSSQV